MQLPANARRYVYGVIGIGAGAILSAFAGASPPGSSFPVYLALAIVSSMIKIRLHGVEGAFSLNFLFLLMGAAYYSLAETLAATCAAAAASTLLNAKQKPLPIQFAFNIGNLALSVCASYLVAHEVFADGLVQYRPAWLAIVACTYFVVNSLIVAGVLTLLTGQKLAYVNGKLYLWALPYYLIGAAVVGILPVGGNRVPPESWLIPLPLLYLVHFFYGLERSRAAGTIPGDLAPASKGSRGAAYFTAVVTAADIMLAALSAIHWSSNDAARFLAYSAAGIVASMCKIHLPGLSGTMSCGFVMTVVAIVELTLPEIVWMGVLMSLAQALWRPKGALIARQLLFSTSALVLSSAVSAAVCRWLMAERLDPPLPVSLAMATALLYCTNSILVSSVMCLAENRPLLALFQRFYFWGLPYYLVGAVASGLIVVTARQAGWMPSLLVLPMMGLVYYVYMLHVRCASQPVQSSA